MNMGRSAMFVAVCAVATTSVLYIRGESAPAKQPHIIMVVIDTLRADALGGYGNISGAASDLDAILEKGVVFNQAYS